MYHMKWDRPQNHWKIFSDSSFHQNSDWMLYLSTEHIFSMQHNATNFEEKKSGKNNNESHANMKKSATRISESMNTLNQCADWA